MPFKHWLFFVSILMSFALLPIQAQAGTEWRLSNSDSRLNFISVKKSTIAETHRFSTITGTINDKGEVYVSVDLSSVDTNIDIRDERMQKHLFETDKYSNAEITAKVNASLLENLKAGDMLTQKVSLTLSLHGKTQTLNADLNAVKLSNQKVLVSSVTPIMLNANQFDLMAGIVKLQEIAGLPSISSSIPVTFQLVFEQ